jgi:hypothetical protein
MGDKSPKATGKITAQKQTKSKAATTQKAAATAAKSAAGKKK